MTKGSRSISRSSALRLEISFSSSGTTQTTARRTGAKGVPKVVEVEAAKMVAEVDIRGGYRGERRTVGELLDEYLRHEARGRAPTTLQVALASPAG